ncbi:fumarylacetoacetate hydrolase family protein [Caballeronia sordidicola]|uniref:Putative fumarylacetoacetate (FAA) hydrolase n=1 Tax=Caballeronia sordidicola TaxID=196367 RepID=A0A242MXZ8_CABSO|nr:fumarylacetoacetate hydrolase family protein [Caballeronia sordidicola]OTP76193.1 putative fumarylacetoacetate (FAA) hydrolase [Caballeronia sordidicola]
MKLISFLHQGNPGYGVVVDSELVVDLTPVFGPEAPDLKALIAGDLLSIAAQAARTETPTLRLSDLELLPVIPNPGAIFCVGLNYSDHVLETGRALTDVPTMFLRTAASQVAHHQAIVKPPESSQLDFEGEIAVIIGRDGRRISEADAWSHVAGYACYNDASIRDWQLATTQWTAGKNFWRTGAFGPWMVTADEIFPGQRLTLTTRLNGQEVQRATTDHLIHSIPRQIAYISAFTPLRPGDVIVTGTPGGIGSKRVPPLFMKAGDTCEVEVDAIGVLRNEIADESVGYG